MGMFGLALQLPKGTHFQAGQRMGRRRALFDSTDVQDCVFQVYLLPAQVNQLGGPQTMPEGQQDHG